MLNVNSPVVLIGDTFTQDVFPYIEHVHMSRFAKQAVEFQNIYRHFSPNGPAYEMFCFMRWFILRDFMKAYGLSNIVHLDSDVLINVNVQQEQRNWLDFGLTILRRQCAGNMFVNGTTTLDALCEIIWDLYASSDSEQRLALLYERDKGICDMTTLGMICDKEPHQVGEMDGIQPDGSFWDANIKLDQGFETDSSGVKAVRWIDGRPFCRHLASGRDIFFKSLHYQGQSKHLIEPAFREVYPLPKAA